MKWTVKALGASVSGKRFTIPGMQAVCLAALVSGCSSRPSALTPPSVDADAAAAAAMNAYDKNQDGAIAGDELDAAPELKGAMSTLDENNDGQTNQAEIAARIESWEASNTGVATVRCTVTLDGRPLQGALVTFKPASYLGEGFQPAAADTTFDGIARPTVPKDKRPTADAPPGMAQGFYQVQISKVESGKETLPAKYNENTQLGMEVSLQNPAMMSDRVRFELKSD